MNKFVIVVIFIINFLSNIKFGFGHGMMLEPIGRASRWRIDETAVVNNNDDGLYCGGLAVCFFFFN